MKLVYWLNSFKKWAVRISQLISQTRQPWDITASAIIIRMYLKKEKWYGSYLIKIVLNGQIGSSKFLPDKHEWRKSQEEINFDLYTEKLNRNTNSSWKNLRI